MKFLSRVSVKMMLLFIGAIILKVSLTATPVHAKNFTARHLGDYGNVTVMEVSGNFDTNKPDGSLNLLPRQTIAKEFFSTHKDEYDFVAIFTNFDYQLPPDALAYYTPVKNDIQGIGQKMFDNSTFYGSNGRLQGTIDMWNLLKLVTNPIDPKFNFTIDTLVHETLHRWGAYVHFKDWNGIESKSILGYQDDHWSFLFDSGGSTHYGNKWRINGDGTFTSTAVRKYYSPLDLYLMGMIDKSKVPPTLLIDNPTIDPAKIPEIGATISGTARYVTVDDIIALEGERIPAAKDAQKQFKAAFIYTVAPGTFNANDLPALENLRSAYLTRFSILTDGQGLVQVASAPKEDLPVNPGVSPPTTLPRTLPPNVNEGISWLAGHQQADGSWTDFSLTTERDTAETVSTLQQFPAVAPQFQAGLAWLAGNSSANTDFLARRIEATQQSGGNTATLVQTLLSLRNPDGGWGSGRSFLSNPADTGLALKALASAGYSDSRITGQAIDWLRDAQNPDGGWGGGDGVSAIQPTAAVLTAFNARRQAYPLEERIGRAVAYLTGKQNPDGGFGNSPSTVYDTALAVTALQTVNADRQILDRAVAYLQGIQSGDGSWYASSFQTALAVRAVWNASFEPDLAVTTEDMTIIPATISSLPTAAVLGATIRNLGRTDVTNVRAALFDSNVAAENKVGEQSVAVPGLSAVTVTFAIQITEAKGHNYILVVDPDNLVKETNKVNNTAVKALMVTPTYDFETLTENISATPNPANFYQEVTIRATVTNKGAANAYNVPVRIFLDDPGTPMEIATVNMDIPAGGSVVREVVWKATRSGTNLPLTVMVDPLNTFKELSKSNNRAVIPVTINGSSLPNLAISYREMTVVSPVLNQGGSGTITVQVHNSGASPTPEVNANLYFGVPGASGILIGSQVIPVIPSGGSFVATFVWNAIAVKGEGLLYLKVDPDNFVSELTKADNNAFVTVTILSLPDLAISANSIAITPSAPRDGDTVSVTVTVQNLGDQPVADVLVQLAEGGAVISARSIATIAGKGVGSLTFTYRISGAGAHELSALIDPDNKISEQTKENNRAVKRIMIQNADLWVSERYFSPNGDGVKDNTELFFRLENPADVRIEIRNRNNELMRVFSGGDLLHTGGTSIVWNGLKDDGAVVDDGEYRIWVFANGNIPVGSAVVEVDTNRSSLLDAIKSNALVNTNLSCNYPGFTGGTWLPDGSGQLFWADADPVGGVPDGLYLMEIPGGDVRKITPASLPGYDPDYSYKINEIAPSANGSSVTFSLRKKSKLNWSPYYIVEQWSIDLDGRNLALIDSYDTSKVPAFRKQSPDGRFVSYYLPKSGVNITERATGTTVQIPLSQNSYAWLNDSSGIVFVDYSSGKYALTTVEIAGNRKVLYSTGQNLNYIGQMQNGRILAQESGGNAIYWLFDRSDAANNIQISLDNLISTASLSPDRKNFVFGDGLIPRTIKVLDQNGTITTIKENLLPPDYILEVEGDPLVQFSVKWTPDSSRIVILDYTFAPGDSKMVQNVTTYSVGSGAVTTSTIVRFDYLMDGVISEQSIKDLTSLWLNSSDTLLAYTGSGSMVFVNIVSGEVSGFEPPGGSDNWYWDSVSPFYRFIQYDSYAPSSCSSQYGDSTWVMSSGLNLTADLQVTTSKAGILLKGTAVDRNFAGYRLDYADVLNPGVWSPILPPADISVVNNIFTAWVPPGDGSFYVRLTAWDLAGNSVSNMKRAGWGGASSITGLNKSRESFSPNGDGVNDTVELTYRVLEPVHLEFQVLDKVERVMRTFDRDYTGPKNDVLSWDGRDESGNLLPDGLYRLKIQDIEFAVALDTVVPQASLTMGRIEQYSNSTFSGHIVKLNGLADDDRQLKKWTLSYGEGENPSQWTFDGDGSFSFTNKNDPLIQLVNAVPLTSVGVPIDGISWIVGKKFRLDVEDRAGNRKTAISDFLEERVLLTSWDDQILVDPQSTIPSSKSRTGIHKVSGFHTVRSAAVAVVLQYAVHDFTSSKDNWFDAAAVISLSNRNFTFTWEKTASIGEVRAMRIKITDEAGVIHYSTVKWIEGELFTSCSWMLRNTLYERPRKLELQVQSPDDPRYKNWTTYLSFQDNAVPEGTVSVPPQNLLTGKHYFSRVLVTPTTGAVWTTTFSHEMEDKCSEDSLPQYKFWVKYQEGDDCGSFAKSATVWLERIADLATLPDTPSTIQYFQQEKSGPKLLGTFDNENGDYGSVEVDLATFAEGDYVFKAVITTKSTGERLEFLAIMKVDRTLPTSRITYPPVSGLTICPAKVPLPSGDRPGITVEGVAYDASGIDHYELYYGAGAYPSVWKQAKKADESKGQLDFLPIMNMEGVTGSIGTWDLGTVPGADYTLKLKVVDKKGNVSCATAPVRFDSVVQITSLTADNTLFSPNGDGSRDSVTGTYVIDKYSDVASTVRVLPTDLNSPYTVNGLTVVKTFAFAPANFAGSGLVSWDGKDNGGNIVTDGRYGLVVTATDSCGNSVTKLTPVEVDTTLPQVQIVSPLPATLLPGTIIDVKGTATDLHFTSYTLEFGEGVNPATWTKIAAGIVPVTNNLLGTWNAYGLKGVWTLRLSATDMAVNRSVTMSTVDLGIPKAIIKSLDAAPRLFSPNGDQKLDSTTVAYEVTAASQIRLDIIDLFGAVVRSQQNSATTAGLFSFVWDGRNDTGRVVDDGTYTARLTASVTANPPVTQTESIFLTVDTASPGIVVAEPADKSFLNRTDYYVSGSINDANLAEYSVSYTGPAVSGILDAGSQSRNAYVFGRIVDLVEDVYTIKIQARDQGDNTMQLTRNITIDRTPPKVSLKTPSTGDYFGGTKNNIIITGTIVEKNLDRYSLRYGQGEAPDQWRELSGGTAMPASDPLALWKVGVNEGVADGVYILSLYARDKAGLEGDARSRLIIDNTPPTVAFSNLKDGDYVKEWGGLTGTVIDDNPDKGALDIAEGQCSAAFKWTALNNFKGAMYDAPLTTAKNVPADGGYCLRLSATDKSGNRAESKVYIKIDTNPPAAPQLTGNVSNRTDILLIWAKNSEPDLAGYNLYRNGLKTNAALVTATSFIDAALKDGNYTYMVKAVDLAGNESAASPPVTLKIDLIPPAARIATPLSGTSISGLINIKGNAYCPDDFKEYRIYIGTGGEPSTWNLVRKSFIPTTYGILAQIDTVNFAEGLYSIKLEAEDTSGNIATNLVTVIIDNTPPAVPLLLTAEAIGSDVTLTWRGNSEPDLDGYLIYRNDQLANASGIVTGNLRQYLTKGTSFIDRSVPDGMYTYSLVAMDQAGNSSGASNGLVVEIDVRRPHAIITEPLNDVKFDKRIPVRAESSDNDIKSVQLRFKKIQESSWTDFGALLTKAPFSAYFDPDAHGLPHGDYQLMAIAADKVGADPAPTYIAVTYGDLTPPNAPQNPLVKNTGNDVTISWNGNIESDLDGYFIYRLFGAERIRLNVIPLKSVSYHDTVTDDGIYHYEVTAVDVSGNESAPSSRLAVKIYAPFLVQPFTPVAKSAFRLLGSGATTGATVEILRDVGNGNVVIATGSADTQGNFAIDIDSLAMGENRFTARAIDSTGNVSRVSPQAVVVHDDPPTAPTGLNAAVNAYDVALGWNNNPESDIAGYNLYRKGSRLNAPQKVTAGEFSVSSDWGLDGSYAMDGDNDSYWASQFGYGVFQPQWWQITLPQQELINRLEVNWGTELDSQGNEYLYAGRAFEVQVWSGYAWIPLTTVAGNGSKKNSFDFKSSYRTDSIRLFITESTDTNDSRQVRINEIVILKDNLVQPASFVDHALQHGTYGYAVTAVDQMGFESDPSSLLNVAVGDVTTPATPAVPVATATLANISLDWSLTPNIEPDLAGYHVYRNSQQGWIRLTSRPQSASNFLDADLLNGAYSYRLTSVDLVGNESDPSISASATVHITTPQNPPPLLKAIMVPEGKILKITWDLPADPAVNCNIYRSNTSGGPYLRIASIPMTVQLYLDAGLTDGIAYYYVATAADKQGNESSFSNEATGIPADRVAPAAPRIISPITGGGSFTSSERTIDIGGMTEPGLIVDLFRNNVQIEKSVASITETIGKNHIELNGYGAVPSPDGRSIVYMNWNDRTLQLLDVTTGSSDIVTDRGGNPVWSPNGKRFAFEYYDGFSQQRIGIFDMMSKSLTLLTDTAGVWEESPSWSGDGSSLAYLSGSDRNVVVKNIVTGTETRTNIQGFSPRLSPDGKKIAFFSSNSLYIADLRDESRVAIDDSTNRDYLAWSPDSSKVAYESSRTGAPELYVNDITTRDVSQLTNDTRLKSFLTWSPDGQSIAYGKVEADGTVSVIKSSLHGQERLLASVGGLSLMSWGKSGDLLFFDKNINDLYTYHPPGIFLFNGVSLDPGENVFTAVVSDVTGNISSASLPVSIFLNPSLLPDITVRNDDIYLYPLFPKPGDTVDVNLVVSNSSDIPVDNVDVDVYLWDSAGNLQLLHSTILEHLDANGSGEINAKVPAGVQSGTQTVIAVVDPNNKIIEQLKTNNMASKEFYITGKEVFSMLLTLDAAEYSAGQVLHSSLAVNNSGQELAGDLAVTIEDSNGDIVTTLNSKVTTITYGSSIQNYQWSTGSTFAGAYRLHALFTANDGTKQESSIPFSIRPDIHVDVTAVTDRKGYGTGENVSLNISIKNNSNNYVIPRFRVVTSITGPAMTELFRDEKTVVGLLPAADSLLKTQWNTVLNLPGAYQANVAVYLGDSQAATAFAPFFVNPVSVISGTLSLDAVTIPMGSNFNSHYNIMNSGNVSTDGIIGVDILDPGTATIVAHTELEGNLPSNGSLKGALSFSTIGLKNQQYKAVLRFTSAAAQKNIASATLTLIDSLSPQLQIVSPEVGKVYMSSIELRIMAQDDESGVDRVEYQLDGGGDWRLMPLIDVTSGVYGVSTIVDNGLHTISFRGTDKTGNRSVPVSATFTVQRDVTPPVLTLSTLTDGCYTNNAVLNIDGTITDDNGVKELFVNSAAVLFNADGSFSKSLQLNPGANPIEVKAFDLAGNHVTDYRTITLDQSAPAMEILTPADNSKSKVPLLNVTGTVDETSTVQVKLGSSVQTATMNATAFAAGVTLVPGNNTIEITATDLAGNSNSLKRSVLYDDQKPSLAITNPAQDIRINQSALTIRGTVSDPYTSAGIRIDFDGQAYTPAVVNGQFEQPISFPTEKTYAVLVTATNEVGNTTTVQRNIIYDITSPSLTINPLPILLMHNSQIVTGTRESGLEVIVICPTATIGAVVYPSDTTWSVMLSDLHSGENRVSVNSTDLAGNRTTARYLANKSPYPPGNVTMTGEVWIGDAVKVWQASIGNLGLSAYERALADVAPLDPLTGSPKGNDTVDIADAIIILRKVIGGANW